MTVIPPTIIAIAIRRRANIPPSACHSINLGKRRLRIKANINTNTGRLPPTIVDTSDTGPAFNARNMSNIVIGANISLNTSQAVVEPFCFRLASCRKMWGRSEVRIKMPDMQNPLIQNMFQDEI